MNNTEIIFLVEESNEGGYEAHSLGYEDTTGFNAAQLVKLLKKFDYIQTRQVASHIRLTTTGRRASHNDSQS
jgi:hypothetical protein